MMKMRIMTTKMRAEVVMEEQGDDTVATRVEETGGSADIVGVKRIMMKKSTMKATTRIMMKQMKMKGEKEEAAADVWDVVPAGDLVP